MYWFQIILNVFQHHYNPQPSIDIGYNVHMKCCANAVITFKLVIQSTRKDIYKYYLCRFIFKNMVNLTLNDKIDVLQIIYNLKDRRFTLYIKQHYNNPSVEWLKLLIRRKMQKKGEVQFCSSVLCSPCRLGFCDDSCNVILNIVSCLLAK